MGRSRKWSWCDEDWKSTSWEKIKETKSVKSDMLDLYSRTHNDFHENK